MSLLPQIPGAQFVADASLAATGLVGTIGVRIHDPVGNTDVVARTTAGITEQPALSGIYFVTLTAPLVEGTYSVIWDTGGVAPLYAEDALDVTYTLALGANAIDLCVLADVKLAVGITTTTDDTLIQELITAASRTIMSRFQREFAPVSTSTTRRFRVDGTIVDLAPYDLQVVSGAGVVLDPDGTPTSLTAITDYKLKPRPTMSGTYYKLHIADSRYLWSQTVQDYGYAEVDITGTWGFASIPSDVARAAAITAGAWIDRGADVIAAMDNTVRNDGTTMATSWAIPAAAYRLLQPWARVIP